MTLIAMESIKFKKWSIFAWNQSNLRNDPLLPLNKSKLRNDSYCYGINPV